MKTKSSRRVDTSRSGEMFANRGIHSSQLMELFEDELKDIYWAEKELTKEIPFASLPKHSDYKAMWE